MEVTMPPLTWETDITRNEHNRRFGRYPSDLTHAEWAVLERLVPVARSGGRAGTTQMREVVNGILSMAGGGKP